MPCRDRYTHYSDGSGSKLTAETKIDMGGVATMPSTARGELTAKQPRKGRPPPPLPPSQAAARSDRAPCWEDRRGPSDAWNLQNEPRTEPRHQAATGGAHYNEHWPVSIIENSTVMALSSTKVKATRASEPRATTRLGAWQHVYHG